jgi:hypothetical protein
MKKLILIIVAGLFTLISCRKTYNCNCVEIRQDQYTSEIDTTNTLIEIGARNKISAREICTNKNLNMDWKIINCYFLE